MDKAPEEMNYKEFYQFCEARACDGRWSLSEAVVYTDIIKKINRIKVKGLFKKKKTEEAREEAWRKFRETGEL